MMLDINANPINEVAAQVMNLDQAAHEEFRRLMKNGLRATDIAVKGTIADRNYLLGYYYESGGLRLRALIAYIYAGLMGHSAVREKLSDVIEFNDTELGFAFKESVDSLTQLLILKNLYASKIITQEVLKSQLSALKEKFPEDYRLHFRLLELREELKLISEDELKRDLQQLYLSPSLSDSYVKFKCLQKLRAYKFAVVKELEALKKAVSEQDGPDLLGKITREILLAKRFYIRGGKDTYNQFFSEVNDSDISDKYKGKIAGLRAEANRVTRNYIDRENGGHILGELLLFTVIGAPLGAAMIGGGEIARAYATVEKLNALELDNLGYAIHLSLNEETKRNKEKKPRKIKQNLSLFFTREIQYAANAQAIAVRNKHVEEVAATYESAYAALQEFLSFVARNNSTVFGMEVKLVQPADAVENPAMLAALPFSLHCVRDILRQTKELGECLPSKKPLLTEVLTSVKNVMENPSQENLDRYIATHEKVSKEANSGFKKLAQGLQNLGAAIALGGFGITVAGAVFSPLLIPGGVTLGLGFLIIGIGTIMNYVLKDKEWNNLNDSLQAGSNMVLGR